MSASDDSFSINSLKICFSDTLTCKMSLFGYTIRGIGNFLAKDVFMTKKDSKTQLIHRLNRAQGQIEALKKIVNSDQEQDCLETLRLIKAVNNALKKFGEAYVSEHLDQCIRNDVPKQQMQEGLQEVITSAFSL